ncbi:DUF2066 domain-containing protein [Dokdonella sp.]|uniref:DUF2066 domain-containing protein n=1 Tax=Dokdonella sp. TaxID=2291710 RepID=UPI0025BB638C|nr:DUF2066 domain-containing protein [Dokdonella sp.]MBX3693001.1 DUF2066 domain-containing protein [Dokdonella sp.]
MHPVLQGLRRLVFAAGLHLVACLPICAPTAFAAPPTYRGEASVASQAEGERNEGLKNALGGIVMRLSGDSGVLARGEVAHAVAEAPRYVLQYQYRRDSEASQLVLVAEFDAAAVDAMLARLGLADRSAVANEPPGTHRLWIAGIQSAVDYARLLGYLDRHALVREVRPLEARGDGLLIEVGSASGLTRLLDALGSEGTLGITHASPPLDGIDATLALLP